MGADVHALTGRLHQPASPLASAASARCITGAANGHGPLGNHQTASDHSHQPFGVPAVYSVRFALGAIVGGGRMGADDLTRTARRIVKPCAGAGNILGRPACSNSIANI